MSAIALNMEGSLLKASLLNPLAAGTATLAGRTAQVWPLIPFSEGPAVCPGRNLALLLSSAMLARLLDGRQV
jgi:cytochrome P450